MKKSSLLIALILFVTTAFSQSIVIEAGSIEVSVKNDKKRCRLRDADGATTCGFYSESTKTFFDCAGRSVLADTSQLISAPDCCSRINLGAGTVEIAGTVKINGRTAVVTGDGLQFTIDMTKLNATGKKLLRTSASVQVDMKVVGEREFD
jgi:hypothetical protein